MTEYVELPTRATDQLRGRVELIRDTIRSRVLEPEEFVEQFRETIRNHVLEPDDLVEEVEHFNYQQDLKRRLTVSSIVGLGFSLMSVPFGISTTLAIGLIDGGNVTILWGWVMVSILSLMVALSLGEIAGKYPSSGGVYHFAAILLNPEYSLMSSWCTGWFLIMGNWTTLISIMYGGSQFILSVLGLQDVYYKKDTVLTLFLFFALILLCGLINYKFAKYLDKINNFCTYWTIYTVLLIDILLMLFSNTFHNIKYILTNFNASRSGWPDVILFFIGLQPALFTLQGYGMILSMSDEVKQPVEKTVPKGMCISVAIAGVTGIIFIIPILTILPELTLLLDQNPDIMPIDLVFKLSTESFLVSFLLVILLVGTVLFAGIGSLTTASRSTYAFARDGGLPFRDFWCSVDLTEDDQLIPTHTLLLSMGVCAVFGLLSLISSALFNAFMGSAVITLSIANGIPILSSLLSKRKKIKGSSFKLGKLGWLLNMISLVWISITMIILCMPPQIPITVSSMNYSIVVCVVFTILMAVSYVFWGKNTFQGPKLDAHSSTEFQILSNGEDQYQENFIVAENVSDEELIEDEEILSDVDFELSSGEQDAETGSEQDNENSSRSEMKTRLDGEI